jgi:hypothetical protein
MNCRVCAQSLPPTCSSTSRAIGDARQAPGTSSSSRQMWRKRLARDPEAAAAVVQQAAAAAHAVELLLSRR